MKTITKTTKAIMFALLAMILCVAMALTACNGNNTPQDNDDDATATVITKYDATFDASIVMGPMGEQSFASVFSNAYITKKNNQYSLTVLFTAGELNVGGIKGTIFIDNNPATEKTVNGVKYGTIGYYNADGTLITDGIKVTYSSGENYAENPEHQNVYYVQSVEFPVDALRATYDLTLYINSNMMGEQFIKDVHDAKITLDLESGEVVNTITGLGVDTLGTVVIEPETVEPVADKYTKYSAQLDAIISMGQNVNFTENLFDGVYVIKKDSKYEITLIFNSGEVNMPFGNKMAGFLTNSQCPGYRGGEPFMPVWGYYNGETLVKEGVSLTYSSGDDYVTVSEGSYYYVQSMTFAVDSLEDEYILSLCVMAGNETSTSGQQFPYTSSNGTVCNAILTIDLTDAEIVNSIDSLLGVGTLGEVPAPEYQVAILSLETSAPLPAVKAAFSKAFGDSVTLIVAQDGSKKLRIKNEHMVIHMSEDNDFDANVALVRGATVISTKRELCASMSGATEEIEVPDVFEIEYPADCNGVLTLDISVDFMAKMYNQSIEDYSTKVTLTIDISSLNL